MMPAVEWPSVDWGHMLEVGLFWAFGLGLLVVVLVVTACVGERRERARRDRLSAGRPAAPVVELDLRRRRGGVGS